jgi:hypothetical protein
MPRRLLDHLTKTESLLPSLQRDRGLKWLVLDEVDCPGQVEQIVQQL